MRLESEQAGRVQGFVQCNQNGLDIQDGSICCFGGYINKRDVTILCPHPVYSVLRRKEHPEHRKDNLKSHSKHKHQGYLGHHQVSTKNVDPTKETPKHAEPNPLLPLPVLILLPPLVRPKIRIPMLALEVVQDRRISPNRIATTLGPINLTSMPVADRKLTMALIIAR